MKDYERLYKKARICLAERRAEESVVFFKEAIRKCPAEKRKDLHLIMHFFSMALIQTNRFDAALTALKSVYSIRRSRRNRHLLNRFCNDYGMLKQKNCLLDDWNAFKSVHLNRYLRSKQSSRCLSSPEYDMLVDLIKDRWHELLEHPSYRTFNSGQKLRLFMKVRIVYPVLHLEQMYHDNITPVNFRQQKRLCVTDRCSCGSGLLYMQCCGRTPAVSRLRRG